MASDEKYVPGKGLDRSANARLRSRQAEQGSRSQGLESELPGKDSSSQTDFLLGNGAQKIARCGKCTRPLDADALEARAFLCSRCTCAGSTGKGRGGYSDGSGQGTVPVSAKGKSSGGGSQSQRDQSTAGTGARWDAWSSWSSWKDHGWSAGDWGSKW
eukprot:TRINITY_DN57909_c0_g1_i1.p2 TRINITY_DN57909_c0_g1~~TRINITY_DN57909_c0_g1_i1.p2  ORF type:complete len:167 (-),score=38.06 TRINITY_DN57909_c0_g1_i1:8-481(-)